MTWKTFGLGLVAAALLTGCKKDENNVLQGEVVPPRDLSEVAAEDEATLQEFLQTHFYNYEEFQAPPADFDYKIRIDTLAGDNAGKTPLIDQVQSRSIQVTEQQIGVGDSETPISHTLYYLTARAGQGVSPTIGDSVLVRYEGTYLDGRGFDSKPNFLWQELPYFLRGYQQGMTELRSGTLEQLVVNPDGTSNIENRGIGMVILPSGLGYFNDSGTGIAAYSPLIFKIELGLVVENTDADGDGIPTWMEDLNGNGYLFDDNTDEDEELKAFTAILRSNFVDADDDGDGTPTRDEIVIDAQGNISFPDTDGDGTPDYLDKDS